MLGRVDIYYLHGVRDKIFDYKANCAGNIGNISEQFNVVSGNFIRTLWAWRIFTIIYRKFFVHSTTMNAKFSLILTQLSTFEQDFEVISEYFGGNF